MPADVGVNKGYIPDFGEALEQQEA